MPYVPWIMFIWSINTSCRGFPINFSYSVWSQVPIKMLRTNSCLPTAVQWQLCLGDEDCLYSSFCVFFLTFYNFDTTIFIFIKKKSNKHRGPKLEEENRNFCPMNWVWFAVPLTVPLASSLVSSFVCDPSWRFSEVTLFCYPFFLFLEKIYELRPKPKK